MTLRHAQAALRMLALPLIFMLCFICASAERYIPDPAKVRTSVNVRAEKNTQSAILGTIQKGEYFEVSEVQGNWAVVNYNGRTGYVNANYIKADPVQLVDEQVGNGDFEFKFWGYSFSFSLSGKYKVRWMVWLILALVIGLFICSRMDDLNPVVPLLLLLAASVSEIIYAIYVDSFLWFLQEPRWWWIAINFLIFAFCTVFQAGTLISIVNGMTDDNSGIGIFSVPAAIVLGIIFSFVSNGQYVLWVAVAFIIAQLVQAGIIFHSLRDNVGYALLGSFAYLVGMTATLMLVAYLLMIVIIILIALFVLACLGGSGNRDLNLKHIGGGIYEDQYGDRWRLR